MMAVASPPRRAASLFPPLPPLPPGEWPAQGDWTYEDYLRLPDAPGRRYEVLFGVLYMPNTPDIAHQDVVTELATRLRAFVREGHLGTLLVAPFEVRLPGVAQPVQPDAVFVRAARREAIRSQYVDGPPDLVVEVLSPGTARLDCYVKFDAYEQAGVPEHWVANPKARTIEVYALEGEEYALLGEYAAGERIQSRVLEGLDVDAGALFA